MAEQAEKDQKIAKTVKDLLFRSIKLTYLDTRDFQCGGRAIGIEFYGS